MNIINSDWKRIVEYRNKNEFKFWSEKVKGKGDKTLKEGTSLDEWTKIIILKPKGKPDTLFSVGFSSVFGDTIISNLVRRVEEGPFGMRMGPEDCEFFIASNQGEVELEFVRYADINELNEQGIDLY